MLRDGKAILVDITKCIGCRACEQTCKEIHGFAQESEPVLSATALTVIEPRGDRFVRRMCMHCQDPACASACPVGALKKSGLGPVTYEAGKCIGCRYCMIACPFTVPRYEWTKLAPLVKKCDMCSERVKAAGVPACVEACPTGASVFGRRDAMLEEAQRRILGDAKYVRSIYGATEVGGTSVFFISDVPFEKLGFVAAPTQPMPVLSAAALGDVPNVVLIGGSLLSGIYWITQRRRQVAAAEEAGKTLPASKEEK
jgi:formate dehydrogenase iron-sulfur subunit